MRAALLCFCLLVGLLACSSTTLESARLYTGPPLPRPQQILVHDFSYAPEQVELDPGINPQIEGVSGPALTAQQREVGRLVSKVLSQRLVSELREMGLPAERVSSGRPFPTLGAHVYSIEGQFVSIDLGDRRQRVMIGFSRTEVESHAQFYYSAAAGKQLLERAHIVAEGTGDETFGADVETDGERAAEALAEELNVFFASQGWIEP